MPPTNGANIRRIRREQGKRLSDIAKAVGIRPNNFCNIENGKRDASWEVLHLASTFLGVPVEELLDQGESRDPAA